MSMRPFRQVDVFTATALLGNPVAVVQDSAGLTPEQMQAFTDWTNLSEATFLAPPTDPAADYAVRIFCPGRELPFAGHPTLGSAHAWLEAGGQPNGDVIVQECGVGLVRIRHDADAGTLAFAAPPLARNGPLDADALEVVARGLGIAREAIVDHQWCDNGPPWQAVMVASAAEVLAIRPDPAVLAGLFVGVVGPHAPGGDADYEVRAFFPTVQSMAEDPVTGSLNAALAQWLIDSGQAPTKYIAAQGTALGRAGRVHVEQAGDDIWIGGQCVTVLEGTARV